MLGSFAEKSVVGFAMSEWCLKHVCTRCRLYLGLYFAKRVLIHLRHSGSWLNPEALGQVLASSMVLRIT